MIAEIRQSISELSTGITRSLDTIRRSLALIAGMETLNRGVEKIVDGIGMVSVQTNMLAVSGSVEAARAGDLGKGFAVVSKDIRNLARDSGENAGRIKDTVRAIQDQIGMVRKDLDQIVTAAELENQKNASVVSNLGAVEMDMKDLAAGSQQILTSAETILSSLKEGARGAQQVAAAAEEPVAPQPRLLPRRSSRRAVPRNLQPRSRKSPRLPRTSSVAMSKRPQRSSRPKPEVPAVEAGDGSAISVIEVRMTHFVAFQLADEAFGFRLEDVGEIARVPELAHMPLGPRSLLGLANLHGVVLPVVGLRRLLGLGEAPLDDEMRIVVINRGSPVGFVVDRVDKLVA